MNHHIYKYLYEERNKKRIYSSKEYHFFKDYRYLLEENIASINFDKVDDIFDIIKCNILIKSIINKINLDLIIEEELLNKNFNTNQQIRQNIVNRSRDLPYLLTSENQKIFIPFFNKSTNLIYSEKFEDINKPPYDDLKKKYEAFLVNPFETYKISIFDSIFTQLIKVDEDETSFAFYHYDLCVIFIISKQGYLDNFITLFDKHIKTINREKIIQRVKNVVKNYYENNFIDFIFSLYENKLISYTVYKRISKWKNI